MFAADEGYNVFRQQIRPQKESRDPGKEDGKPDFP
jgi:hypothetical protein